MVKSNHLFTATEYLEIMTGKTYLVNGDDDIKEIHSILDRELPDNTIWDYPLNEIDHIVENKLSVVLVECNYFYDEDDFELKHDYRWFEIPESMNI